MYLACSRKKVERVVHDGWVAEADKLKTDRTIVREEMAEQVVCLDGGDRGI